MLTFQRHNNMELKRKVHYVVGVDLHKMQIDTFAQLNQEEIVKL